MEKKELARQKLKELIEKYEANRNEIFLKKNNYNEANTRREYIDPFLEILGWDLQNKLGKSLLESDVIVENYVGSGKKNRADYSLRRNGSIFYTIEAEKPSKDIHKDYHPASQVLRYGWNANNDIGILINFEYIQIYQTYSKPSNEEIKPWRDIRYDQYLENFDLIWNFLSCESVYNETADKEIAKITPESATKQKLDKYFLSELNSWRVSIGQDLVNADEKYIDSCAEFKTLNDDVQVFLNQIIFLRFAEDNQLEKQMNSNELEYIFKDYSTLPNEFDKRLKDLDIRYNSGIFENNSIVKKLQPETVKRIIESLYYPSSVYDFGIIDLGILGKIYEKFLQEVLYVVDNKKVVLRPTNQANISSVVSTPVELTRLITRQALSETLNRIKSVEELLKLKICDIAAGSGVFLVAAYDELENKVFELQNGTSQKHRKNISLEIKKKIISDVLYGYDISSHASKVTKFSLALRLLKGEDISRFQGQMPIIPTMSLNIVTENSLVTMDDIGNVIEKNEDLAEMLPREINEICPASVVHKDFDVILGNPPYLETQKIKSGSQIEFAVYRNKYVSSKKQFDKYFLFIEEMMNRLTDGGSGTLIIQNKFFSIDAAYDLRKYLASDNKYVKSIIDFKDKQLFKGKNTYVAIITFSKSNNSCIKYTVANSIAEASHPKFKVFSYLDIVKEKGNWVFEKSKATCLYDNMVDYPRISEIVKTKNGIQTSKNSVYIINLNDVVESNDEFVTFEKGTKNNRKRWKIEKELLRPFFKNINKKGVYYTQPKSDTLLIFPYNSYGKLIPAKEMEYNYPLCWKYLNDNKEQLLPKVLGGKRDTGPDTNDDEWYKYGRTQGLTGWEREKLIVGVLSNGPSTAYDNQNLLLASGGTAGYIPIYLRNNEYALEYIEAWINYPLTDEMFKLQTTTFRNGYWTHGTSVMKRIPFLTVDMNDDAQISLYKKIVSLTKKINKSNSDVIRDILITSVNKLIGELIQVKKLM